MFFPSRSTIALAIFASQTLACASHENGGLGKLKSRETPSNGTKADWAYEASFDWGRINSAYSTCQNGTQQSPIALSLSNGLALNHTDHPSFTYDNATTYLKGWHIHAPANHSVGGMRSKAELHLVHVDAAGHEAAVLAIRLDPGNFDAPFFTQMPTFVPFSDLATQQPLSMNLNGALESVLMFNEFWTYQGSLTSPPCTEGIRWFVARQIMFLGVEQMQAILGASTYSARAEQQVWRHRINE
ncbi:carbonic anhydrase [Byssothecium circinans]|uniref:Carbonic anhydrase n=1 Tax=Byssothecium circinans TaxID=147558 RepID=A0A6A5TPE9_9PLEO|nr:carbonic anhydrase [Byssothecium circinans]